MPRIAALEADVAALREQLEIALGEAIFAGQLAGAVMATAVTGGAPHVGDVRAALGGLLAKMQGDEGRRQLTDGALAHVQTRIDGLVRSLASGRSGGG